MEKLTEITEANIIEAEEVRRKLMREATKLNTSIPNGLGARMVYQAIQLFKGCNRFSGKKVTNEQAITLIAEGHKLLLSKQ